MPEWEVGSAWTTMFMSAPTLTTSTTTSTASVTLIADSLTYVVGSTRYYLTHEQVQGVLRAASELANAPAPVTRPHRTQNDYAAERTAKIARYREACERADELLRSLLSPEECERYASQGVIHVRGSAGGSYQIAKGHSGNVYDFAGYSYCAHPAMHSSDGDRMPDADAMIAQMLMLVTDETGFLHVANRSVNV